MVANFEEYKEVPGTCVYCGNSPVNHFSTYLSQTISVYVSGIARAIRSPRFVRGMDAIFARLEPCIYACVAMLPGVRFSDDVQGAQTYRSQVVWEEARKRGIAMQQMRFFGKGTEIYRARINDRWFFFQSLPVPHGMDSIIDIIDDKDALAQTLRSLKIPAPHSVSVTSLTAARAAFREFRGPVVVKPRSGSRGRHTSVYVKTESELAEAFTRAQQLCRYVVIESFLEGGVCRGTVVGGKLVGFLQAFPPEVTGDGISTIKELVERTNTHRPARVDSIVLNEEHRSYLRRVGYTVDSVVPEGIRVVLTHRTGRLFGGRTKEMLDTVHPKLREYIERASRATTSPVVGFDLITQHPEQDPDSQQWGIIEGNGLPYIDLHHLPLEGAPSLVAQDVWDYAIANSALY